MPRRDDVKKVLIIGSGPIIIGQACEFDYSGTQACKALRELGYQIVLVNSNPATIMTDPGMADVTYVEPLNVATLTEIIDKERPDALLPNLGGQTALNLSMALAEAGVLDKYGVRVIGVNLDAIKRGEDRETFKETMTRLGIAMPSRVIVSLKVSRSSPRLMASRLTPITRTPYLSRTPASASAIDRLRAVCPPRFGNRASGRSLSMISVKVATLRGST